jgi:hypothetical protein
MFMFHKSGTFTVNLMKGFSVVERDKAKQLNLSAILTSH